MHRHPPAGTEREELTLVNHRGVRFRLVADNGLTFAKEERRE
jgi:hypothetical protein